jgi:very-short-patch-repair endonuclease
MVQAPSRTVFNPSGKENSNFDSSIVSITPKLPYYVELRTNSLITFLQTIYTFANRDAVQSWLQLRQKTGFYFEINEHLHLAFADQRDGKGSLYWWVIYYDKFEQERIVKNIKIQQHSIETKLKNQELKEDLLWNGLTFRSQTEIKIAKVLYSKNIIFFANANGFMGLNGLPITNHDNKLIEKAEIDFLVIHNQKCMILEVDGVLHNETLQRNWDCKRDRVFLRQGIPTVRFSADQCLKSTSAVIDEFLQLFN